jgi:dolichol-phosphate mannosyltransferase
MDEAKGYDDIRIINMSRCFGVSPCVMAGMQYSTGDAVIYMDTDLQDPPEVIPELLKVWREKKVDIVHTKRLKREGETFLKIVITKIGYFILRRVSDVTVIENVGDFKLLSRRAVNYLLKLKEKNPFMRGLALWIGFKQEIVHYNRAARFCGKTKFPILGTKVVSNFVNSALISFSSFPLKLVSFLGIISFFVSIIIMGYVLYQKFLGRNLPGWTAIMEVTLFVGSIQLLSMGILGIYIYSIFLEVKNRPNYIVESMYGFDKEDFDNLDS